LQEEEKREWKMNYSVPKPPSSLAGKVAIVTGAGAYGEGIGNGRASAILLADQGCSVVCVDLDVRLAERTVEMILSDRSQDSDTTSTADHPPARAIAVQADVSVEGDCQRIVQRTLEVYGRLDILINCVGVGGAPGTAVEVDMAAWAKGMSINVASMVMMSKYAIPAMLDNEIEQGWMYRGSIVNMASVAGLKGGTPHLLYPTSKGAVVNLTRAMAAHHAPQGIRVNCVCPGMVYTPMMYAGGMSDEARQARKNRSLLKTEGNGWDVGCAVRFLAGPEARWMTGVILPVDAGVTAAVGTDIPKSASVNG
jgi:NAD(P)-dependent dehydrogenase (short-subunit alcohol dehydrogenase family)